VQVSIKGMPSTAMMTTNVSRFVVDFIAALSERNRDLAAKAGVRPRRRLLPLRQAAVWGRLQNYHKAVGPRYIGVPGTKDTQSYTIRPFSLTAAGGFWTFSTPATPPCTARNLRIPIHRRSSSIGLGLPHTEPWSFAYCAAGLGCYIRGRDPGTPERCQHGAAGGEVSVNHPKNTKGR
jgi:hypothetical protein